MCRFHWHINIVINQNSGMKDNLDGLPQEVNPVFLGGCLPGGGSLFPDGESLGPPNSPDGGALGPPGPPGSGPQSLLVVLVPQDHLNSYLSSPLHLPWTTVWQVGTGLLNSYWLPCRQPMHNCRAKHNKAKLSKGLIPMH